jgi:hypothetical protein
MKAATTKPMINIKTSLLLFFLVAASSPSLAQKKSPVSEITAYTTGVEQFTKNNKRHRRFADVASETDEKEIWREFKSDKALKEATWYQAASVFSRDGKIVAAYFTFTSPSGDWYHFVDYYFRDDGSLAKIRARLNTSYGNITVVRQRYYDSTGKLIKSTRKFLNLKTSKETKPVDFMDEPIPAYLKVSALPFQKLL